MVAKRVLIIVGAVVAALLVLDAIGAFMDEVEQDAPTARHYPAAPVPAVSPLTGRPLAPPTGQTLFCSRRASIGSPYYVQLVGAGTEPDMCTAADRTFTQEEFQEIPGLTRRCVFERAESIAQKRSTVSIYSDETPGSINAAQRLCTNAAY
jgi:hypothetical protein